jgi:hypothetical protein
MTISKMKAAEHLLAGDLVAVGEDGKVRFVEEGSVTRPLYTPETVDVQNAVQQSYFLGVDPVKGAGQKAIASVTLPSSNYAVGFTSMNQYHVSVFAKTGELLGKATLGAANEDAEIAMVVTAEGHIAVATKSGSDGRVLVSLFNEAAQLMGDDFVTDSETSSSLGIAALTGGNIVATYATNDSNHKVMVAVFGGSLQRVGEAQVVDWFDVKITFKQSVAVAALSTGEAVIAYGGTDGTVGKVFFKILDTNGQPATSGRNQAGEDITPCVDAPFVGACALQEGFAVSSYGGFGPGFQISLFNAIGENLGGNLILAPFDQNNQPNRMAMACLANGNLAVVWAGPYANGAVYTPQGQVVFSKAAYGRCLGSVAVAAFGDGAVVAHQGLDDDNREVIFAGQVGPLLYGDTTVSSILNGDRHSAIIVSGMENILPYDGATMLYVGTTSDEGMVHIDVLGSYKLQAQSVIGVVAEDAEPDADVSVYVDGEAELRVPFKFPTVVDTRNGKIRGQELAIIGNTVFMKGIF